MADDDLGASLPDPPPPNAVRREAAIGEAMRRFDGAPADLPPKREPAGRGAWIRRPQFGALVTVGLMAVIGLPVAWRMVDRHAETAAVGPAPAPAPPSGVSVPPAAKPAADPDRTPASPPPSAPPVEKPEVLSPAAKGEQAPARAEPAGTMTPDEASPARGPAAADLAEAGPARFQPRAPGYAYRVAPPPPPPPPPPTPPVAMAQSAPAPIVSPGLGNIVVTSRRRNAAPPAGRGDWNACTVEDPSRTLSLCRGTLPLSAHGAKGIAAAHVADGLTRAWQDDMDGAITAFDAAIAAAPKSSQAYLNRSLAYARIGEEDRALADADAAVRYAPNSAAARYNRSVFLRHQGKIAEARRDEDRAVEIDPAYEAIVPR